MTRLPEWSTATLPQDQTVALLAGPPSLPAGVVSRVVCGFISRTAHESAKYARPAPNDTPHSPPSATSRALAGPPAPPATVEISPAAVACPAPGAAAPPGWPAAAAGHVPASAASPSTVTTRAGTPRIEPLIPAV